MKAIFVFAVFLTINQLCYSQIRVLEEGQAPGSAQVEQFNWLVGYWTGPGLGGDCEEVWMPAVDGHMVGTFRFWQNEKLVFSEFMNLVQEEGSVSLKLKHFNPDLTGWEEKEKWTTFRLVELGENIAYFHGLTIERKGDQMTLYLALTNKGVRSIEEFHYVKKAL